MLFRLGFIVLDRNVFGFQVKPILKRGSIKNIREYTIMHNYIEMLYEKDPESFSQSANSERLNSMLNEYHNRNP